MSPVRDIARDPWRLSAAILLSLLLATCVYRAHTQSITHDEAVMFEWFLSGSWDQVLSYPHGNHHVVSDLLSKLSISIFGLSELSLRVPALIGAALYFYSVFRISDLLFAAGFRLLLSVSILSMNPFVLDYLACARGYGAALGFFFFALFHVVLYFSAMPEPRVRALHVAGVALGLSVGSNAVMVFPGAALALSLALLASGGRQAAPEAMPEPRKKERKKSRQKTASDQRPGWSVALAHFALPTALVGGFFSMLPKRLIELEAGHLGPPSLVAILQGLVRNSLFHAPSGFRGLAAWPSPEPTVQIVAWFVVLGMVAVCVAAVRTRGGTPTLNIRVLRLLGAMLPLAAALIAASRYLFGQPYPELRTAMYWLPILSLAAVCLEGHLSAGASRVARIGAMSLGFVLALGVAQFATQFNTRYFAEWAYCAGGKDIMQTIRAARAKVEERPTRIGVTWQLEPVVNFYRVAWKLDWIEPATRQSPDGVFDYYVLLYGDTSLVKRRQLKVLLSDSLSGAVLARQ